MFRLIRVDHLILLCLCVGVTAACDEALFFLGPLDRESCSQHGRSYQGDVPAGTWTRAASPHVLRSNVIVTGKLTIEAGALVCGMPGSSLEAAQLVAIGTATSPILFTATGAEGWGGLRVVASGQPDSLSILRHARIEDTEIAVRGYDVTLEDVHVVRTRSTAISGPGLLRNVVIDSACSAGNCAAVQVLAYHSTLLENVTIRASGGMGIAAVYRC